MAAGDFWGEIQEPTTSTPVSILKEQAALLGPKTQYLVEARINSETTENGRFVHEFNLVVPSLRYTYQLFRIVHGVDLYPVKEWGKIKEFPDEHTLREWLRERLSSADVRRVVGNLILQARS